MSLPAHLAVGPESTEYIELSGFSCLNDFLRACNRSGYVGVARPWDVAPVFSVKVCLSAVSSSHPSHICFVPVPGLSGLFGLGQVAECLEYGLLVGVCLSG